MYTAFLDPARKRSNLKHIPVCPSSKGSSGYPAKYQCTKRICVIYMMLRTAAKSSSILQGIDRNMLSNRDIGFLCRYVCEYYLRWGPEETIQKTL